MATSASRPSARPGSVRVRRRGGALALGALAVVLALAGVLGSAPTATSAAVPASFADALVAEIGSPTGLAFTPDGRVLVTTQGGQLRVVQGGVLRAAPALALGARVCADSERGLLGIAVDPGFAANRAIYLFYTFNKHNTCARNTSLAPVNRVSRFTLADANTVDPASEVVLVDNMPSPNGNHNAGDVAFGKDGLLYVSIGDGGCDLDVPTACAGQNANARDPHILTGKILRVTRDGAIPAGNPFTGANSSRCNATGRTSVGRVCQETFATGLRNPFRFAFDPNAAGTRFYINDVGQNVWEEVDNGVAGADYGWNIREGFCANGSATDCGAPPAGLTNPVHAYQHANGCNSIAGGAFVPNGIWPAEYDNTYLYTDYVCGRIFRLAPDGTRTEFASGLGNSVVLAFGPDGSDKALYYTTYTNGGQVRKITYGGTSNRAPVAVAAASPTTGALPLAVQFTGSGSSDPDNDPITYDWDFGDGTARSTVANPSHTYTTKQVFTATLTVRDNRGGSNSQTVRIDAGNTAPTPTISSPTTATRFRVGQTITLTGSATDAESGTLPDSALSWRVLLHHDTHTHPLLPPTTGNNVTFTAPAPEDLLAATNSYLEVYLTATDPSGLSREIKQDLLPNKVNVTLASSPTGRTLTVNGTAVVAPRTIVSWEGYRLDLGAASQVSPTGSTYEFLSWSDGGAATHPVTTGATAATYTATFRASTGAGLNATADARVEEANPTVNFGTQPGLRVEGGTDPDSETYLRFSVSGLSGTVARAQLWLFVPNETDAQTVDGPAVYATSGSWTETGITWANRPARTGPPIADKGAVPANAWAIFDVTPLVTGNGTVNLALATGSTDALFANAREAAANRPRLVITTRATDTTSPTTPGTLSATAATTRVDLRWGASTDAVGVVGYEIWRNNVLLTTVGAVTTYADTTVAASTPYQYKVRANDAAGNRSAFGNTVSLTTPAVPGAVTILANADARVQERNPTVAYGRSSLLTVDGGADPAIESYVRFAVSGLSGAPTSAKLRLFVPNSSSYASVDGPALYTAPSTWSETTITWNNRPLRTVSPIGDKGAIPANAWVEYDVTGQITGNGTYTFVLATGLTDQTSFTAREGANKPQLVLNGGPAAAGDADPTAAPEPTATPTPEPIATATTAPTAVPTATATPAPVSALPFADGFESGDLAAWTTSDGLVVAQDPVAEGAWAARAVVLQGPAYAAKALGVPEPELSARLRFTVGDRGPDPLTLLRFDRADGPLLTITVERGDELGYRIGRSRRAVRTGIAVTPGIWQELQAHVRVNGPSGLGVVELYLDGALIHSAPADLGADPVAAFVLGEPAPRRGFAVAFDAVALDRTCLGTCPTTLILPTPTAAPATATPVPTAVPPTATPIPAVVPPTATPVPVPPTATATPVPAPPTATATAVPPPAPEPTVGPAAEETGA